MNQITPMLAGSSAGLRMRGGSASLVGVHKRLVDESMPGPSTPRRLPRLDGEPGRQARRRTRGRLIWAAQARTANSDFNGNAAYVGMNSTVNYITEQVHRQFRPWGPPA